MLKLTIPQQLKQEFATVDAIWQSAAETRRVDSLLLSWVKYEKQLRRLFCFLLYQHPNITATNISTIIAALAQNNRLYPETFINGIRLLGVQQVPALIGTSYATLKPEIDRIKLYRNKLMHGQVTGLSISSHQLELDVRSLVGWVSALAIGADGAFGYDGLRRNTFKTSKTNMKINVAQYPFAGPQDFSTWLRSLV